MRPEPRLLALAVLLALVPLQPAAVGLLALAAALVLLVLPMPDPVPLERP